MFSQKIRFFITFILASTASGAGSAHALVLGEYEGQGTIHVSMKDEKGDISSYVNNCSFAYNIDLTENSFEIPFNATMCNSGLDSGNDKPIALRRSGQKLFLDQTEVGGIEADGTISFDLRVVYEQKLIIYHIDRNCRPSSIEHKTYQLPSSLKYTLKPIDGKSYSITRVLERDALWNTYVKEWPNCPSGNVYVPVHEIRSVSTVVSKK